MTLLLERHKQAKALIGEQLAKLAGIAEAVGMRTLERDIRASRIPKLESEHFHLVVLGEFNHGKSTFVNALLGDEVLPTGITPTTAAINHVVYADRPWAHAVLQDGTRVELDPNALEEWVTVTGARSKEVRYVEVGYPAEPLKGNITLVDTPGVNDLNEQRAEITYGYVPRADAVIFLLDAGQALKDSEREFLASHVLEGTRNRMIFVLGKMDLLSEDEKNAVLRYVRKELAAFADEPLVFSVSARDWLTGKQDASGLSELTEHLNGFLEADRAQILLDNAAADASRTAAYLEKNLGVKLRSYDLDLAELEQRVGSVREQLDASKKTLDGLHDRIRAESEAIKSQVHLDLDTFAREFIEALPDQIEAVDGRDVKAFIGSFVEDKFREWSELEGAKIASMLEHLAEDVIAVTNENVAAASAALADRIGPADTEVDIDIDSFKYDVGVYAVGALGTTLFLFINTLAGGLLTLAAPVFAIMVKSKVSGDIKEQAKERVPAAIHRAADVMRPHFDEVIEEFVARLGEFVTSAGNTLYKGISEILDQTIEERRSRAGEIEALRSSTEELVQRAHASQELLDQLRENLWSDDAPPDAE